MFYSVETKAFRGNETLYRECGHKHKSIGAAIRCKKHILNRKPEQSDQEDRQREEIARNLRYIADQIEQGMREGFWLDEHCAYRYKIIDLEEAGE